MKEKFVGTYNIGLRPIRLYANLDKRDGSVNVIPKDRGSTKVNIGIDQPWNRTIGTLLHETYEVGLIDLQTRYEKSPTYSDESSDFIFLMTHNELGEMHEFAGEFLANAIPDLQEVHDKFGNRTRKKKK